MCSPCSNAVPTDGRAGRFAAAAARFARSLRRFPVSDGRGEALTPASDDARPSRGRARAESAGSLVDPPSVRWNEDGGTTGAGRDEGKGMMASSREASGKPSIAITYPFPLGEPNGGSRHAREIARHLGKLGADVVIIPVSATPGTHYPRPKVKDEVLGLELDAELSRFGVDVVRVPQHPLFWRFDGRHVKRAISKILERRHVDIVLSFHHEAAPLPSFLKSRNVKFGYIAAWQSYAMALKRPRGEGKLLKLVRRRADMRDIIRPHREADILFANSRFTRGELMDVVGVDGSRIVVSYLGVDPSFMKIPRAAPDEVTRFIFFGRVVPLKGVLDAIEALGRLQAKGLSNWTFRVLGSGDEELARSVAREHGVSDKVHFCGSVGDERLRSELEQAHLAILPSYAESFGLSVAEAQAAGISVVAYEAGSVPEVVEHGVTAWLAPVRDVDGLARHIEAAVNDPEMAYRAGLAGRERVARMFTWDKTARTILDGIRAVS